MKSTARFSVDPRLSALLGESYTSSEHALRELVDNAWDAEARVVKITLPDILSEEPVVIEDGGHGMKNQEVRQEYLKIASPRFSRKGERTPNLDRKVKGRRGIGKFSGLTIGDEMEIVTRAQGVKTTLLISKELLLEAGKDIEEVDLPINEEPCDPEAHGTTITIRKLNPRLSFPQPDKLREQVAYDYGRETGFQVQINGEPVLRHDVQGTTITKQYLMPDGTKAEATWTVTENPLPGRKAGLILRSGEKSVGKPHHWGLEHDEELSKRLINRVVGEVIRPVGLALNTGQTHRHRPHHRRQGLIKRLDSLSKPIYPFFEANEKSRDHPEPQRCSGTADATTGAAQSFMENQGNGLQEALSVSGGSEDHLSAG